MDRAIQAVFRFPKRCYLPQSSFSSFHSVFHEFIAFRNRWCSEIKSFCPSNVRSAPKKWKVVAHYIPRLRTIFTSVIFLIKKYHFSHSFHLTVRSHLAPSARNVFLQSLPAGLQLGPIVPVVGRDTVQNSLRRHDGSLGVFGRWCPSSLCRRSAAAMHAHCKDTGVGIIYSYHAADFRLQCSHCLYLMPWPILRSSLLGRAYWVNERGDYSNCSVQLICTGGRHSLLFLSHRAAACCYPVAKIMVADISYHLAALAGTVHWNGGFMSHWTFDDFVRL